MLTICCRDVPYTALLKPADEAGSHPTSHSSAYLTMNIDFDAEDSEAEYDMYESPDPT